MVLLNLMIQVVSGVIGGNAASGAFRHGTSSITGDSLLGALGGVCCSLLLGPGGLDSGALDLASMATQMGAGTVGGSVLVMVTGVIRASRRSGFAPRGGANQGATRLSRISHVPPLRRR